MFLINFKDVAHSLNPPCSHSKYLCNWNSLFTLQALLQIFTVHRRWISFHYSPSYSQGDGSEPAPLLSFLGNAHVLAQNTKPFFLPVLPDVLFPTINIFWFSCSFHWRRPEMGLVATSHVQMCLRFQDWSQDAKEFSASWWWSFQPNNLHPPMVMEDA